MTRARTGGVALALLVCLLGVLGFTASAASAAPRNSAPTSSAAATRAVASVQTVALAAPLAATHAAPLAAPAGPDGPVKPTAPAGPTIGVDIGTKPSQSVNILLLITVLSVAPSLLLLVTSFTKIFIVLSLTRNALGLTTVPPNQVLAGLSLFLSLFVMGPVLEKVNKLGIQPYLKGTKPRDLAWKDGTAPLRDFMLAHTRPQEIALMLRAGNLPNPPDKAQLELTTIIPAFVLSELRAAMIIGFVVYVPFVIIDLVVSSSLMSLGMMMLPPVSVSLPFKLLLFVLVDGWGLVITSLVQSYHTG